MFSRTIVNSTRRLLTDHSSTLVLRKGAATTLAKSTASSSSLLQVSWFSTQAKPPKHAMMPTDTKVMAPPMVYIAGEEMTHYACELFTKEWFEPFFDLSAWERYDLSCKARDETDDKVLHDAVAAGKRVGAIFKEPTITPSAEQVKEFGLKKAFGSPNVSIALCPSSSSSYRGPRGTLLTHTAV